MKRKVDFFKNKKKESCYFNQEKYPEWTTLTEHVLIPKQNKKPMKRLVGNMTKKIVAASQEWKCGQCNIILPASFQVDHIIPLHLNGSNEIHNLMALCAACHAQKSYLEMAQYFENSN